MALADLQTALNNIDIALVEATVNPKPNYAINGQNVSWGDYLKQLTDARTNMANLVNMASGPGEYVVEGVT